MRTRSLLHLAMCGVVAACGGRQPQQNDGPSGSAIVVRASTISGNLLEGLRTRVPNMSVSLRSGECPRINFRGARSIRNPGNPAIYVDGTHMLDTCVLTQMSASDVDYIEIYPSGNVSRPGVRRSPFGLILVFRRRV